MRFGEHVINISFQVPDVSGRMIKAIDNATSKEINHGDLKSGLHILNLMMKVASAM